MDKHEAIRLLGGSTVAAAEAIGVTPQAISGWPDFLPRRLIDRVQAALYRREREHEGKKAPSETNTREAA